MQPAALQRGLAAAADQHHIPEAGLYKRVCGATTKLSAIQHRVQVQAELSLSHILKVPGFNP